MGQHDAMMASCDVAGSAISDKVTVGVALEAKKHADLGCCFNVNKNLQLHLSLSYITGCL